MAVPRRNENSSEVSQQELVMDYEAFKEKVKEMEDEALGAFVLIIAVPVFIIGCIIGVVIGKLT